MPRKILTCAAAVLLLAAAPLAAQAGKGSMLNRLDSDGDKAVSKEEARQAAEKRFDRLDADQDGAITKEEWLVRSDERFQRLDLDSDGQITGEEIKKAHQAWRDQRKSE